MGMVEAYERRMHQQRAALRQDLLRLEVRRIATLLQRVSASPSGQDSAHPGRPPQAPSARLLNTTQAAERLGVSRSTLYRLVKRGLIPARRNGRHYYFVEADLYRVTEQAADTPHREPRPKPTSTRRRAALDPLPPTDWNAKRSKP